MFENPRRVRQARNFTTNVPKILDLKSSSEQIFSRKLPLGAPDFRGKRCPEMCLKIRWSVKRPWYRPSMGVTCSGLWNPGQVTQIVPLKWDTLETCMRRHTRLSVMYKMYRGFLGGKLQDYLIPNRERRTWGSHDFNFFIVPKGHKAYFRFSLFPETITEWKRLPKETVTSQSLSIFNSKLF